MSSAENDTRPVWLTWEDLNDECDNLRSVCKAQWKAAPADSAEAVRLALYNGHEDPVHGSVEGDEYDVLAALGAPKATP